MKISQLIRQLEQAYARFGDVDVVVGEASGIYRRRIDLNVENDLEKKVAVVQAYVVKGQA